MYSRAQSFAFFPLHLPASIRQDNQYWVSNTSCLGPARSQVLFRNSFCPCKHQPVHAYVFDVRVCSCVFQHFIEQFFLFIVWPFQSHRQMQKTAYNLGLTTCRRQSLIIWMLTGPWRYVEIQSTLVNIMDILSTACASQEAGKHWSLIQMGKGLHSLLLPCRILSCDVLE